MSGNPVLTSTNFSLTVDINGVQEAGIFAGQASASATAAAASQAAASAAATTAGTEAATATSEAATATSEAAAASASAAAALASQNAAAGSAAALQAGLASFEATWLGPFTTDPTVNPTTSAALVIGAEYLNTSTNPPKVRVYTSTGWQDQDATAEAASANAALAATQAGASAAAALASQNASAASAATATTQATNAAASAASALGSAATATTQATNAAASAAAAATSATAVNGVLSTSVVGGLTLSGSQASNGIHVYTGTLTANTTVTLPMSAHPFTADNKTTGAFTLTISATGGSASIVIPQGQTMALVCDGSTGILPQDNGTIPAAIAKGTATATGALTGTETFPASRGSGLLQATSAQIATLAQAPIANGTATGAGVLTGAETIPASRAAGLLQTTTGAIATLAQAPIAGGSSTDAGALTGAEILPASRGAGLLQTTLTKIATFISGALPAVTQVATGQFFQNLGARINRFNDRVFVGAATVNAGNPNGTGSQDWMEQLRAFSTSISQHVTISKIGQIAVAAGSRTSDSGGAGSMGCIGYEAIVNNDNTAQVQYAYGAYLEARRQAGAGTTHGLEIDPVNLGAEVDMLPYGAPSVGITPALWLASGGGVSGANPATAAIGIISNGTTFKHGIVFGAGSLKGDTSGPGSAVAMATSHQVEWYDVTGALTAFMRSDATTHALPTGLLFLDGHARVVNSGGYPLLDVPNVAASVNYAQISPSSSGNPVVLSAQGTDPAIQIALSGKGGAGVTLVGTSLGDDAAVGQVGEYASASPSSVGMTTGTAANIASVSLSAGDWDISAVAQFIPAGGTTMTSMKIGISTVSTPTFGALGTWCAFNQSMPAGQGDTQPTPVVRISSSTTITVYLVASTNFSGSTLAAGGFIRARRVR